MELLLSEDHRRSTLPWGAGIQLKRLDWQYRLRWPLVWLFFLALICGVFFLGLFGFNKSKLIGIFSPVPETPAKNYEVFGFAPYWTLGNMSNIDWNTLTTFAYFSLPVLSDGTIDKTSYEWTAFGSPRLNDLFEKAKSHHVRRVITLTQMDPGVIEEFLNNPNTWNKVAYDSIDVIKSRNLDGVNIDFEYMPSDDNLRSQFSAFVDRYSQILRSNLKNPYITVSVLASSVRFDKIYDIGHLSRVADGIFMMAYDFYYPGSDTIGPAAPLYGYNGGRGPFWYDVSTAVADFLTVADPKKIILGIPYYGWNYPAYGPSPQSQRVAYLSAQATTNDKIQNNQLLSTTPAGGWDNQAQVSWRGYYDADGWHVVYLEDSKSLLAKYDFAKNNKLGGVGIWALGYDGGDENFWSLLQSEFATSNLQALNREAKPADNLQSKLWLF